MNNTFSISRLALLFRQNWMHNNRLIWLALIGYCGVVTILLLIFQAADDFRMRSGEPFQALFLVIFIVSGLVCAGSAFASFRSKEKTYTYLMVPASHAEKFAVEFIQRVVLFVVLVPILFYIIYVVEGSVVQMLANNYTLNTGKIFQLPPLPEDPTNMKGTWVTLFIGLLSGIFIIPFTGSVAFEKHPLIKTMFTLAIMVFMNSTLVYLLVEITNVDNFEPADRGLLFGHTTEVYLTAFTWFVILIDISLLAGAYFKLKEKEA